MVLQNIVSQHAEESAFLWLLRDDAVTAPHYRLDDLIHLESRIDAHLDGIKVAGSAGWDHCVEQLGFSEKGEVFTAAYTALDSAIEAGLAPVLEVLRQAPEATRGLVSALGWVEQGRLQGHVVGWLQSEDPLLRQVGLSACAIRRVDCGEYLKAGVEDADPQVRARALRSVGEIRRRELLPMLLTQLGDSDADCRFWAAWSACLLGSPEAEAELQQFAETPGVHQRPALELLMRNPNSALPVACLRSLSQKQPGCREVVEASGWFGDPASLPWLLEQMKQPAMARVAGEALSLITGLDLTYLDLDGDMPDDFEAGPTDDPQDERVALDEDEDLPWPDRDKLVIWWQAHQSEFTTGRRYLCGQPIDLGQCREVLRSGFQRQRRAAALEWAMLESDRVLFNTADRGERQRAQLA
ncbi:MAG: TIGR02270 family protein [Candidatus Thiodiazotropha sp.]